MAESAALSTSSGPIFTIAQGAVGVLIQNDSGIDCRFNIDSPAANSGATKGVRIKDGEAISLSWPLPLTRSKQIHGIAASGTPTLTILQLPTGE